MFHKFDLYGLWGNLQEGEEVKGCWKIRVECDKWKDGTRTYGSSFWEMWRVLSSTEIKNLMLPFFSSGFTMCVCGRFSCFKMISRMKSLSSTRSRKKCRLTREARHILVERLVRKSFLSGSWRSEGLYPRLQMTSEELRCRAPPLMTAAPPHRTLLLRLVFSACISNRLSVWEAGVWVEGWGGLGDGGEGRCMRCMRVIVRWREEKIRVSRVVRVVRWLKAPSSPKHEK